MRLLRASDLHGRSGSAATAVAAAAAVRGGGNSLLLGSTQPHLALAGELERAHW